MRRPQPGPTERGQATVELALTLPFVALLLLAVAQVLVVAHAQLAVEHAAREGARAAAVDPSADAAARAVAGAGQPPEVRVEARARGPGLVEVVVRRSFATDLPLVGALLPDLELEGRATFRQEGDEGDFGRSSLRG